MATSWFGAFPLVFMFASLAAGPLVGPPRPLDPKLAAIAPEECLFYASSAGLTEADPKSTNQTEQLFAEPEVQYFVTALEKQILNAIQKNTGSGREEKILADTMPVIVKSLFKLPMAVYVEDFQVLKEEFRIHGGLVISAGDQRPKIEKAIQQIADLALENGVPIGTQQLDGEIWSVFRSSMQTPELRWGWQENYFVLGVGNGTTDTIRKRMQGPAPAWLKKIRSQEAIPRESTLGYFNVERLWQLLKAVAENNNESRTIAIDWALLEKIGLTSVKSFHSIEGFDEQRCVSKSHLATDGSRKGVLSLLPYKPLSKRDLTIVPKDAMLAVAKRVDAKESWDNLVQLIGAFDPKAVDRIERALRQIDDQLQIDVEDDILRSLDDTWAAYLPAGDLTTSWLGVTVTAKVKDSARLQSAVEKLVAIAQAQLPANPRRGVKITTSKFEENNIYVAKFIGQAVPFSPAWCVTDERLIVGLAPQAVRSVISRSISERDTDSLADVAKVREQLSRAESPSVMLYCDTPNLVRSVYPWLQIGAQMLSSELEREGISLDTSILPSVDSIARHLRPGVSTISHSQDGFHFHASHSLPGTGNFLALAPVAVGGIMPAAQSARVAARRNNDLNNLRQLALAFHNYESAKGKLPANIYDKDGKVLLSWRVQILPYLVGNRLYEQFRLDEPWDSPHNKKFIDRMPAVFMSNSNPAAFGKTRYLVLAGEETLFPGNKKLGFRDVTDGLSNTVMFVEAGSGVAVPWTKPADVKFNKEKPFEGIGQLGSGYLNIAMGDGSCRTLAMPIDFATMSALATRAGGETVSLP